MAKGAFNFKMLSDGNDFVEVMTLASALQFKKLEKRSLYIILRSIHMISFLYWKEKPSNLIITVASKEIVSEVY